MLGIPLWKDYRQFIMKCVSISAIRTNGYKYRNFPFYVIPYSFAGNFGQRSLFLLLAALANNQIVGLFALAMRLTNLPIRIVSAALRQVFFPKAVLELKTGNLEPFVIKCLALLVMLTTPILVGFIFNANWLFRVIFGPEWNDCGTYAIWLSMPAFMMLTSSWLDRVYDILGKQRLALVLEILYELTALGLFGLVLVCFKQVEFAVATLSVVTVIYMIIWLSLTFRLANFSLSTIKRLGFILFTLIVICGAGHWILVLLFPRSAAVSVYLALTIAWTIYLVTKFGMLRNRGGDEH
jgi:O-antigen/teichoic acid export membrane protein